jgi:hypothetical protein
MLARRSPMKMQGARAPGEAKRVEQKETTLRQEGQGK